MYGTSKVCIALKMCLKHTLLAIYNHFIYAYALLYIYITEVVETDIKAINQAKGQKRAIGPGPVTDSAGEAQGARREAD